MQIGVALYAPEIGNARNDINDVIFDGCRIVPSKTYISPVSNDIIIDILDSLCTASKSLIGRYSKCLLQ